MMSGGWKEERERRATRRPPSPRRRSWRGEPLAKQLKAGGDATGAAAAKVMRKPTVAQWMTGEVERRYATVVESVRVTSKEVAEAQEAAIVKGRQPTRSVTRSITATRPYTTWSTPPLMRRSPVTGRSTQHHDEVFDTIEAAATADASPGTFEKVRDDLDIPELAQRPEPKPAKPKRDPTAGAHRHEARDAIANAEEAVVQGSSPTRF